jgi:4-amino-4-deoxy-L-arabinose transferase-like glycosyltransferase
VNRSRWLVPVATTTAAFALRVHHLGRHAIWLDEAFSFHDATGPHWVRDLRFKDVPPLYPLLLGAWIRVAGDGEVALRLVSALCGTAFVAATMWTCAVLFDRRTALWAGLVAATSPIAIYYAQEARPYALLALALVTTYGLAGAAVERGRPRDWARVAFGVAAVLYTHFLGALALVAMPLLAGSARALRGCVAALVAGSVLFLPWLVWSFVLVPHSPRGLEWIADAWRLTPPLWAPAKAFAVLYVGPERHGLPIALKQFDLLAMPGWLSAIGIASAVCVAVSAWRTRRAGAVCALALTPVLALWLVSFVKPIYLVGRYDQLALPAFVLLMGCGFARVRRTAPRLAVALLLAYFVPIGVKLWLYYVVPSLDVAYSKPVAAAIERAVRDDDALILTDYRAYTVLYELHRLGYRVDDGVCAGRVTFACRMFLPREARGGSDDIDVLVEGYTHDGDHVRTRALVAFGRFAIENGSFQVPEDEALLVGKLAAKGYRLVGYDTQLGIAEYRLVGSPG